MAGVNDIGIDLGSSHVLIYMKGKGIILREASVVAIDRDSREIIAFGEEASRMIGRTPGNILALRPLRDGSITDYELVSFMLKGFVMKAVGKHMFARPRAILAVPSAVNEMERRSLISTMFDAGMRRTQLLNRSLAAALGAGLPIDEAYGTMIAIVLAVIVYIILSKTTFGYQLKACGSNRYAARYAGIKDKRNIVLSMAIAGSLAGAAGSLYYLSGNTEFFWSTYQQLPAVGFNGIPVALLASNHPIGVIFAGMFMSMLDIAGLQLTNLTAYNEYITDVIIAVIVYLAAFSLVIRMWLSGSGKRRRHREEKIIPATQETNNSENIDRPAGDGKEAAEK